MAKKSSKKADIDPLGPHPDSDEHFAFIAGYTSGGTAYGLTWEEHEKIEVRQAA